MSLKENIAAYGHLKDDLELEHFGKWVVFHQSKQAGLYDSFQEAAADAARRFGNGPYLIRRIGDPPVVKLPASVIYRPANVAG